MARQSKDNSAKPTRMRLDYLVICLGVVGYGLLIYTFRRIVEEAVHADETHTSGAISAFDIIGSVFALVLIIGGLVAFYRTFVKDTTQHKKANQPMTQIKIWSFWSLICSCLSLFNYFLAIPTIAIGIIIFMLAVDMDKTKRHKLWIYIAAGSFAIASAGVHYLIVSGIK
jgi:Ca2+/Na+ antiporter